MRHLLVTGLCVLTTSLLSGCKEFDGPRIVGSGNVVTKQIQVDAFDKINLVGGFEVEAVVGGDRSLSISTDDNIFPIIETSVMDGTLTIRLKVNVRPSKSNLVKVTTPSLTELSCEGAADATISGIHGESFSSTLEGASSVKLSGHAANLSFTVAGAGKIDAMDLPAEAVTVKVDGAGSVDTHAVERLDVTINGFGHVRYAGDPELTKSISGLGTVTRE